MSIYRKRRQHATIFKILFVFCLLVAINPNKQTKSHPSNWAAFDQAFLLTETRIVVCKAWQIYLLIELYCEQCQISGMWFLYSKRVKQMECVAARKREKEQNKMFLRNMVLQTLSHICMVANVADIRLLCHFAHRPPRQHPISSNILNLHCNGKVIFIWPFSLHLVQANQAFLQTISHRVFD